MDMILVSTGVRAVMRAAQSGAVLYAEHARDRAVFLPSVQLPEATLKDQLQTFLDEFEHYRTIGVFANIWNSANETVILLYGSDAQIRYAEAFAEMQKVKALSELDNDDPISHHNAKLVGAGAMVEQWRLSKTPPSIAARFALTVTDIGLEFVSSNPDLFGIGGKGEEWVVSFTRNLSLLLPDDTREFGQKEGFANRLLGVVLRASLSTLVEHPDKIFGDEQANILATAFINPVIESLPSALNDILNFQDVVDTITGPAVSALLGVVAENPSQYLGAKVKNDKAFSALSKALFTEASKISGNSTILDLFGKNGMLSLYQATMTVAIKQPEVFIKDNSPYAKAYESLIAGIASTISEKPHLDKEIITGIASAVVTTVGEHAGTLFDLEGDDAWDSVALSIIQYIADDLNSILTTPNGAQALFNRDDFKAMTLIVIQEVNANPMMLGIDNTELQAIVNGITTIMSADKKLLLSKQDWMVIASLAAKQAARNPGKLFNADSDTLQKIISSILTVASNTWQDEAANLPKLIFGKTLLTMIEMVIEQLAQNIQGAIENNESIAELLTLLLTVAQANPNKIGSVNLLSLFEQYLAQVLATGTLPTIAEINTKIGVAA